MEDIYKFRGKYKLTESEEVAFNYIINNIDKSLEIGVRGVARECFTSTSVIMNLTKKLGYKGFIDMIYRIEKNYKLTETSKDINKGLCINFTEEKKERFIELLINKRTNPIYFDGKGFSHTVATYLKQKFMVSGYFAMMSGFLECVEKKQENTPTLIVVSKSGETPELKQLCERAIGFGVKVISFTGVENTSIGNISTINFLIENISLLDDRNLEYNDFYGNCILFFEELFSQVNK